MQFLTGKRRPESGKASFVGGVSAAGYYSALFTIVAAISFLPLFMHGKGFINNVDGLRQQYGLFVDTGLTVRQVLQDYMAGKGFHIPFYDFSMGYGSARRWSFDPFMYLSVFVPVRYAELAFDVITVLRLWMVGLAFLPLAKRLSFSKRWAVIAALSYAYSSSGLNCMLQTTYLNAMALLPLVICGALDVLDRKGFHAYVIASAVSCIVLGVYTLYVIELLVACLVVAVLVARRSGWRTWVSFFVVFVGCIACAMLMGAVRLTDLLTISSLDRVKVSYNNGVLYSLPYYARLISGFAGHMFGQRDWFFGYGAIALVCCGALWLTEPSVRIRVMRILFVMGGVFVCVPFFGSAFNGFSYAANRWIYGYALAIACIIGEVGPIGPKLSYIKLLTLATMLLAYALAVIIIPDAIGIEARWQILLALLMLGAWIYESYRGHATQTKVLFDVTCVAALALNYAMFIAPYGSNWQSRMLTFGSAYKLLIEESPVGAAQDGSGSTSRFDRSASLSANVITPGLLGARVVDIYGVDYYASLYNNDVDRFHTELALAETGFPLAYYTLDQRSALMHLLGVDRYVCPQDDSVPLPYGVVETTSKTLETDAGVTYELHYENQGSMMALLYDASLAQSLYDKLTPLEKQEALLQAVVLDDGQRSDGYEPELTSRSVPFEAISMDDGLVIEGNSIEVKHAGTSLCIELHQDDRLCESYLYISQLEFEAFSPRAQYNSSEWAALSKEERTHIQQREMSWSRPSSFTVGIQTPYSSGVPRIFTADFHLYGGKDTWLWNMGFHQEPTDSILLTFDTPGRYTFDTFEVLAQPMDTCEAAKQRCAIHSVKEMVIDNDRIDMDVNCSSNQYLFLSIPYSDCWSAIVDGLTVDILKADSAFMALALDAGEHHITMSYSPNFFPSYVSVATVATYLLSRIVVVLRRKRLANRCQLNS